MNVMALLRAALQAAVLFGAGLVIPVIGQAATFFTPVPVILVALRHGFREALAALALAAVLVTSLAGWHAGVVLLLGFGLMAIGIAYGMRTGMKTEQSVLLGGLLPVAAALVPLAYYAMHASGRLLEPAEKYLQQGIQDAVVIYRAAGMKDMVEAVNAISDRFVYYFVRLLPGITVTLSLAQAASCLGFARALLLRTPGPSGPAAAGTGLTGWHAPDLWVWGLIAALALSAVPQELVKYAGINLAIIFFLVYTAQGMVVVEFYFRKAGFGPMVRGFLHAVILALPSIMFLPPLGVVDVWADFRKVRNPGQGTGDELK